MPKRIIICSDGTWNTPDQKDGGAVCPSNVVKMSRAVAAQAPDGTVQVVFYDQGVGTAWGLDRWIGGAFGEGLTKNIEDAYRFLVDNYAQGDEIYLFGFSRGAYTARSTAGMIRNCGVLRKQYAHKFPEAHALYRSKAQDDTPDGKNSVAFRKNFAHEVRIRFIGVWDTVGALGIPLSGLRFLTRRRHQFHDVQLSRYVDCAYQALAIDEQRKPFAPAIWETKKVPGQKVEQVWFAGVHTNIGGGYKDSGLSDLTFLWMKEKAEACGLAFDQDYIKSTIHPNACGVLRDSRTGLYKFTPRYVRAIGQGKGSEESIHPSVLERCQNGGDYPPDNVAAYLQRTKPAMGN